MLYILQMPIVATLTFSQTLAKFEREKKVIGQVMVVRYNRLMYESRTLSSKGYSGRNVL